MATKEQVTEYIDNQFEKGGNDANVTFWEGNNGARLGLMQNWMSPEIAKILRKLRVKRIFVWLVVSPLTVLLTEFFYVKNYLTMSGFNLRRAMQAGLWAQHLPYGTCILVKKEFHQVAAMK